MNPTTTAKRLFLLAALLGLLVFASAAFAEDTTPPETTITGHPTDPSTDKWPAFTFTSSEGGSTFRWKTNTLTAWEDCGGSPSCNNGTLSFSYWLTGFGDGNYTFYVKAVDAAGNEDPSPAEYSWTVDNTAPETTITGSPANPSDSTSAAFTFSGSDGSGSGVAGFECSLDGAGYAACSSPQYQTGLGEGSHTFYVRAKDNAGNTGSAASYTWAVAAGATSAPDTLLTSKPSDPSNSAAPSFAFVASVDGATFECSLDGVDHAACASPQAYAGLTDGTHTFSVRANDGGTVDPSPASYTWTIDSTPPDTTLTAEATWNSMCNNFSGGWWVNIFPASTDTSATFYCKSPDDGSFHWCGPSYGYSTDFDCVWLEGTYNFYAYAADAAGNADPTPASYTFYIDSTAPDTTIDSGPSDPASSTSAAFTFSGSDSGSGVASFECSLDSSDYAECTSPKTYDGLSESSHTFAVRAKDAKGNLDPSPPNWTWMIAKLSQVIAVTQEPPASAGYGASFDVTATGGVSGNPVVISTSGGCDGDGEGSATITMTSSTTACSIKFNQAGNDNYNAAAEVTYSVTAGKASQTIPAVTGPSSVTYGTTGNATASGGESGGAYTFSAGTSTGCSVSGTTVSVTNASGTCSLTVTKAGDDNYLTSGTSAAFTVALQKADQAALLLHATSPLTYLQSETMSAEGGTTNGAVTYNLVTGPCTITGNQLKADSGTGSCRVTATMAGNNNYDDVTSSASTVTLQKAAQTTPAVTGPTSVTYGTTGTATAEGGESSGEYTFSAGASTGCSVSGTTVAVSNASGTCSLTVTRAGDDNYLASGTSEPFTVTLNKAAQTTPAVTGPSSVTYGTAGTAIASGGAGTGAYAFSAGASTGCSVFGTAVMVTNATGTCLLTVTKAGDNNYQASSWSEPFAVTLLKKPASVTAADKSKTYGDENPALTATVSGQLDGDTIHYSLSTSAAQLSDAGEYAIVVTLGDNPNYDVIPTNGTLTISQKGASVTADAKSKTYGDDNPALTATVTGQVAGGSTIDYTLSTTAGKLSDAGEYPIVVTLGDNPNYHVSKTNGTLTVEPAILTVTPDDQTAQYSDPSTGELTFTYSGWVNKDGPADLTTEPACSTERTTDSPAGTYDITCSGGKDDNYSFDYEEGTYTVTVEGATITYTGDTQVTTAKAGTAATVNLAATLEEDQDGSLGSQLAGRQILFQVYSFGGSLYTSCTATIGSVAAGKGSGACTVSLAAADPYQIRISLVGNLYYTADFESVSVLVNDPGTGMAVGGGWLVDPNTQGRANFGFSAKFLKNGKIQGNSLYIYRMTTDLSKLIAGAPAGERAYNWIIKSNAMNSLNIYMLDSSGKVVPCAKTAKTGCKATITGKNTIQAVDRLTGILYSVGGNYQFQVDVYDNSEPSRATAPDQYAIRVWNTGGAYYVLGSTYDTNGTLRAPLAIRGGNIQVRPQ